MSLVSRLIQPSGGADLRYSSGADEGSEPGHAAPLLRRPANRPEISFVPSREVHSSKLEISLNVLRRGAEALEEMEQRCKALQSDLDDLTNRARDDRDASDRTIGELQQMAIGLKQAYEDAQHYIADLEGRLAETEATMRSERARAERAEQKADNIGRVARVLEEEILSAFGKFNMTEE